MYISKNLSKEIKLKSNTFSLELPNGVLHRT
jgi:hypothetical protein